MVAVDETAERKLSAKVSRPILSCKHGSWDTWNVLMKNYINVHDGWNETVIITIIRPHASLLRISLFTYLLMWFIE